MYKISVNVYVAGWKNVHSFIVENNPIANGTAKNLAIKIASLLQNKIKRYKVEAITGKANDAFTYAINIKFDEDDNTFIYINVSNITVCSKIPSNIAKSVVDFYANRYGYH